MNSVTDMEVSDSNRTKESDVEDGELVDENGESDTEADRLTLRAKRFGLIETNNKPFINPKLKNLHISMGVGKDTRKEALHLYGTDNMQTHDVFAYFSGYSPASIEWLSDKSCNVVWLDEESCAKALKNLSVRIKGQNTIETDISDEEDEGINVEDIRCALPPGIWRKGQSHSLAPSLFMRFATRFDKKASKPQNSPLGGGSIYNRSLFLDEGDEVAKKPKVDTGNPWSDIARQWRNFESRSSSAAPLKDAREVLRQKDVSRQSTLAERLLKSGLENESKINPPAVRKMQADIEEKKILERNKLRANLWRDKPEPDLRDRLGRKRKLVDMDEPEYEEKDSKWKDDDTENVSLRIEIDNSGYSDEEWEGCKSNKSSDSDEVVTRPNAGDLRSKLLKKKSKHHGNHKSVLRTRYMEHPHKGSSFSPLRIEIDNDVYNRSDED